MANYKPVVGWDDNLSNNQQNLSHTAYAVSKMRAGRTPKSPEGTVIVDVNKLYNPGLFYLEAGAIHTSNTEYALSTLPIYIYNLTEDPDESLKGGHVLTDPKTVTMNVRQIQYSCDPDNAGAITTRIGSRDAEIANLSAESYRLVNTVYQIQTTCGVDDPGYTHYAYVKDIGKWIRYTVDGSTRDVTWEPAYTWSSWSSISGESSNKADRVIGAIENNFAALDSTGNLKDSGKKAADFANAAHTHDISDVTNLATQLDAKAKTADLAAVAFSGLYSDLSNRPTIPATLADLTSDATHRTVTDEEKAYWNDKEAAGTAAAAVLEHNTSASAHSDLFDAKADKATTLSGYEIDDAYTKEVADETFVKQVTGKGLTTNDYTTTEKLKLAGIESGAQVNVQSDWTETNENSAAYIKHKPTITEQVQADWTETNENSAAYINHKPTTLAESGIGDVYTMTQVDLLVQGGMTYKGIVETYDDLPSYGQNNGDLYIVKTADASIPINAYDRVIWNGNTPGHWDIIPGGQDLSDYVQITRKVNNKQLNADISLTYSDVGAAATSHTHTISDITSLQSELNSRYVKASTWDLSHLLAFGNSNTIIDSGKSINDFSLDGHTHAIGDVTDLQTSLNGKENTGVAASRISEHNTSDSAHSALFADKANKIHTHATSDLTNYKVYRYIYIDSSATDGTISGNYIYFRTLANAANYINSRDIGADANTWFILLKGETHTISSAVTFIGINLQLQIVPQSTMPTVSIPDYLNGLNFINCKVHILQINFERVGDPSVSSSDVAIMAKGSTIFFNNVKLTSSGDSSTTAKPFARFEECVITSQSSSVEDTDNAGSNTIEFVNSTVELNNDTFTIFTTGNYYALMFENCKSTLKNCAISMYDGGVAFARGCLIKGGTSLIYGASSNRFLFHTAEQCITVDSGADVKIYNQNLQSTAYPCVDVVRGAAHISTSNLTSGVEAVHVCIGGLAILDNEELVSLSEVSPSQVQCFAEGTADIHCEIGGSIIVYPTSTCLKYSTIKVSASYSTDLKNYRVKDMTDTNMLISGIEDTTGTWYIELQDDYTDISALSISRKHVIVKPASSKDFASVYGASALAILDHSNVEFRKICLTYDQVSLTPTTYRLPIIEVSGESTLKLYKCFSSTAIDSKAAISGKAYCIKAIENSVVIVDSRYSSTQVYRVNGCTTDSGHSYNVGSAFIILDHSSCDILNGIIFTCSCAYSSYAIAASQSTVKSLGTLGTYNVFNRFYNDILACSNTTVKCAYTSFNNSYGSDSDEYYIFYNVGGICDLISCTESATSGYASGHSKIHFLHNGFYRFIGGNVGVGGGAGEAKCAHPQFTDFI